MDVDKKEGLLLKVVNNKLTDTLLNEGWTSWQALQESTETRSLMELADKKLHHHAQENKGVCWEKHAWPAVTRQRTFTIAC